MTPIHTDFSVRWYNNSIATSMRVWHRLGEMGIDRNSDSIFAPSSYASSVYKEGILSR